MNCFVPHLLVLSEDRANRQLVTGFTQHSQVDTGRIHPQRHGKGWLKLLESFRDEHVILMHRFPERRVLIVLDSDGRDDRLDIARGYVPKELEHRVYFLSCLDEPERLRASYGVSLETIGERLANDCDHQTSEDWSRPMLAHNEPELLRLRRDVWPIIQRR